MVSTQAVEDGTLEETEAKKYRRRKRKPNIISDADDTPVKVCMFIHVHMYIVCIVSAAFIST